MFKNYCKSYKYKVIKRNLKKCIELNILDSRMSTPHNAEQLDSLTSNETQPEVSEPSTSSTTFYPGTDSSLSDASSDFDLGSSTITEDLQLNSNDLFMHDISSSSESNSTPSEEPVCTEVITSDFLVNWSLRNNITHTALSELLTWFSTKPDVTNLPKDARTLLKTPKKLNYQVLGSGQFYYFSIKNKLLNIVEKCDISHFILDFGIDGLPLHKSTKFSFWPILCKVRNLTSYIFTVAIFYGPEKPPLDGFLQEFINELVVLRNEGLNIDNRKIQVDIGAFCCDAPARAFVKNIKSHTGYNGCDKCMVQGTYCNRRMLFLKLDATLRTDDNFQCFFDTNHHKGITPLSILGIGMISSFPIDYMHSVCLGIMRKLLFIWRDGSRQYKFPRLDMVAIESDIKAIQQHWPYEFSRKPRSWEELERWKATEFRQFLLYVGIVILRGKLPKKMYDHFMLLKFSITVLLNEELNRYYNEYAKKLLKLFVEYSVSIYGNDFCIYNTHSLIHLSDDAKHFGSLNVANCFPFENYLQILKRLLRKSNNPLQQAVNRLYEKENVDVKINNPKQAFQIIGNPITVNTSSNILNEYKDFTFWKKVMFSNYTISSKDSDAFVMLKNKEIVKVLFIATKCDENIFFGKQFVKSKFLTYPTKSEYLSIYEIEMRDECLKVYNFNEIQYKGLVLPYKTKYIFSPLIHLL